jgi:transcription antitermination factor NusG
MTPNWYVAYTHPRCEEIVKKKIEDQGCQTFLPVRITERKWSDRIKQVASPLFPSYLFVYTLPHQVYNLTQISEVSRFISFGGELATVRQQEIDAIKLLLQKQADINAQPGLVKIGEQVTVKRGPLAGLKGLLVAQKTKDYVVIQLTSLQQHIPIEIPRHYLQRQSLFAV